MKKSIFQELVEESIVLLKNEEQILPLKEKKVAFLGRAQIETIFSGNGSGASKSLANKNLLCECEKRGICAEAGLKQFYTSHQKNESEKFVIDGIDITNVENMNCGFMYEIFGKYQPMWTEYHIPEQLMQKAREFTDTAVFVLGRNAGGEECDRHIEGDYELTESEKELLEQVCCVFPHVIVVLNINGMIDMQWVNAYSAIKAVVFLGIPGEEGCGALADILTGAVNPSGKLSFSMAESFKDYPTAENFTWNKEQEDEILTYENYGLDAKANGSTGYTKSPVTVYQEDISETGIVPLWIWNVLHIVYDSSERDETGKRRAGIYYGGNKFRKLCRKRNDTALFVLFWYRVGKTGKRIKRLCKNETSCSGGEAEYFDSNIHAGSGRIC